MINHLQYRKNKEYYVVKRATIIKVVDSCAKSIKSAKKLKRQLVEEIYDLSADSDQDNEDAEMFAIVSIPAYDDTTSPQKGGMNIDTNNSDLEQLYRHNKAMYLELQSLQKLL